MLRRASTDAARVGEAALRALLLLSAAFALLTLLRTPGWTAIVWAALAAVTALRPFPALLTAAGLVPMGGALATALRTESWTEPLVVAFLAGAALRAALIKGPRRVHIPAPAVLLALAVLASCAVELALRRVRMGPAPFFDQMSQLMTGGYFAMTLDLGPLTAGAVFLEGVALFVTVRAIVGHDHDRLSGVVRMMVAGATGAAALNATRLITGALATGEIWSALPRMARATRINVQFADVNAAGSYFAMLLCLALGLVAATRRAPRAVAIGCSLLIAVGLWLTSSRAAILAILATGGMATVLALRAPRTPRAALRRVIAAAGLVVATLVVVAFLPNKLIGGNAVAAAEIRRDMAVVAVRLLATDPVFGIGIGQFYDQSAAEMQRLPVGRIYPRQNAHNNFLQILTELGAAGFACFSLVLWLTARSLWTVDRQASPHRLPPRAIAAALATFLLSALFGHPLIIPACAYAFWMLAGAAASFSPPQAAPSWARALAVAACGVLLITTPLRARAIVRGADLDHLGYGLSLWQSAEDGQRYRVAEGVATIFVPADAAVVRIPLRISGGGSATLPLSLRLHGQLVDRLPVSGAAWTLYKLTVPEHEPSRFVPLELDLGTGHGVTLHVGKVVVVQQRSR